MILEPLPSSFILGKTRLSLPEVRWAYENGLIGAQTVVDVAVAMLTEGLNSSELVVNLAGVGHADLPEVGELLAQVALPSDVEEIKKKWTWIVLSWAYERHHEDAEVSDVIEGLYADLGYPEELASFGPYAPAYQGKRDPVEVRRDILGQWHKYLKSGEALFGK